jgi:small subunit ribosomal protein S12
VRKITYMDQFYYFRMSTIIQCLIKHYRKKKKTRKLKQALDKSPQKKAICTKIFVTSPKKPNSASRKVATVKINLKYRKIETNCHIPGIKHSLHRHNTVLIRGGRVKDLPGVKYRLIRGCFDLKKVYDRYKARSKYGIPKS